jgi:DNA-binding GntR family transcriptional regulator
MKSRDQQRKDLAALEIRTPSTRERAEGRAEDEGPLMRDAPMPLHQQISDQMRRKITGGLWPPHYKLKAEPELAAEFGVSRGTLRRALRTLIDEGLLIKVHGKGTFVSSTILEPPIAQELLSLAEGLSQLGIAFETRVHASSIEEPPEHVRALLDLPPAGRVFRLVRLRSHEGVPIAFMKNYVRADCCPGIERYDFTQQTLFGILERVYHLRLASGRRTFEAQAAHGEIAAALQVPEGSPVLYLEQVVYLANGQPVEYSDVWIRGDRLKLSSVLTRFPAT